MRGSEGNGPSQKIPLVGVGVMLGNTRVDTRVALICFVSALSCPCPTTAFLCPLMRAKCLTRDSLPPKHTS